MVKELTQAIVEQWVALATGRFTVRDIWAELGIESYEGKHHLRTILCRLEEKGIVASLSKDGTYRRVDSEILPLDWQAANPEKFLPLVFPFGLEKWVKIYPHSIIVIAGSKSAGKTAFLYNFVRLNMNLFDVDLYNSETGPEQMKERFDALGEIPNPAPFRVYERYDNFSDIMNPNNVSVIDYLDLNSEVYLVGVEIDSIFRKLKNGVAVIAIQKPPAAKIMAKGEQKTVSRDLGYGGAFSAKRAQLYISMDDHKLKLVYVKSRMLSSVNPVNMQWSFDLDGKFGIHFENIKRCIEGEA